MHYFTSFSFSHCLISGKTICSSQINHFSSFICFFTRILIYLFIKYCFPAPGSSHLSCLRSSRERHHEAPAEEPDEGQAGQRETHQHRLRTDRLVCFLLPPWFGHSKDHFMVSDLMSNFVFLQGWSKPSVASSLISSLWLKMGFCRLFWSGSGWTGTTAPTTTWRTATGSNGWASDLLTSPTESLR